MSVPELQYCRPLPWQQADDDHLMGWMRFFGLSGLVSVGCIVTVIGMRLLSPPMVIDAQAVVNAPIERLEHISPDELNALGLAEDMTVRMFRAVEGVSADDQAYILNHMTPELADLWEENAVKVIETARVLHKRFSGRNRVKVLSVVPVQVELPPFVVEVLVRVEPTDIRVPRGRRIDPGLLEPWTVRTRVTFVRTKKSVKNRDALLLSEIKELTGA